MLEYLQTRRLGAALELTYQMGGASAFFGFYIEISLHGNNISNINNKNC